MKFRASFQGRWAVDSFGPRGVDPCFCQSERLVVLQVWACLCHGKGLGCGGCFVCVKAEECVFLEVTMSEGSSGVRPAQAVAWTLRVFRFSVVEGGFSFEICDSPFVTWTHRVEFPKFRVLARKFLLPHSQSSAHCPSTHSHHPPPLSPPNRHRH